MKWSHVPLRLATGAYILNSGISKWNAPPEQEQQLHGFATGAYPELKRLRPEQFVKLLSAGEIGIGAALLLPVVPSRWAGVGLGAFAAGLVGLYLRTPGLTREGSIRPTEAGIPLAKDVWMLGIAAALVFDEGCN